MMLPSPRAPELANVQPTAVTYRFPSERAARRAFAEARAAVDASRPHPLARRVVYLDTLDWRVYRADCRLALVEEAGGTFLLWRGKREQALARWPIDRVPDFVRELPPHELRERIEAVVDVRRIVPVAELRLAGELSRVVDHRRKIVLELMLERGTVFEPRAERPAADLRPALRVLPVRGYVKRYDAVRARLEREGARPDDADALDLALGALGREPRSELVRPRYDLRPDQRSDAAMKQIHRQLLRVMLANVDGVRKDLDTEFLHDFRVAVRRTRAALAQVPGVFPKRPTDRFRRGFSDLGRATSPLRDLDVFLLALPRDADWLPERLRGSLRPIEAELERQRRSEHRRVASRLDSAGFRRLVRSWDTFLSLEAPARTTLPNAARPIVELASARIRRCHDKVLKKGRRLTDASPARRLHRLRIECKKLRYLLEFFSGLYPAAEMRALVAALKKLQDNLGDFNDYVFQRRFLVDEVGRLGGPETLASDTREAIEAILGRLDDRQEATRAEFRSRFDEFSSPEVEAVFAGLFGEAAP